MTAVHPQITAITNRLIARSAVSRMRYLNRVGASGKLRPSRDQMGCANLAHAYAAAGNDQLRLRVERQPNIGIITAYNDMLSAHQPYGHYPDRIKARARALGATAQVAGGVPAMCDGITQGYAGMELSLFSRDVIAQATAIGLSHQVFDAALLLGVCDKIVPGLLMGAAASGAGDSAGGASTIVSACGTTFQLSFNCSGRDIRIYAFKMIALSHEPSLCVSPNNFATYQASV